MSPGFDRLESFGHDKWTHCKTLLFQVLKASWVDGIKIFDKDDQAAKHCFLS